MLQTLDFRQRFRFRRMLYSKIVAVALLALFVLVAQATWGMYEKSVEAGERRDRAEMTLRGYEERTQELDANIERLSTERGIEEEIRDRFMVAKEGEGVIVVRTPSAEKKEDVVIVNGEKRSIWKRMLSSVGIIDE